MSVHPDLRTLARVTPRGGVGPRTRRLEHAHRLQAAGVPCEVQVVPGAFHGFDVLAQRRTVGRDFRDQQLSAVRRALSC